MGHDLQWVSLVPDKTPAPDNTNTIPVSEENVKSFITAQPFLLRLTPKRQRKKQQWSLTPLNSRGSVYYTFTSKDMALLAQHNCAIRICRQRSARNQTPDALQSEFQHLLDYLNEQDASELNTLTPKQALIHQNNLLCHTIANHFRTCYNRCDISANPTFEQRTLPNFERIFTQKNLCDSRYNRDKYVSQTWNTFKKIAIGVATSLAVQFTCFGKIFFDCCLAAPTSYESIIFYTVFGGVAAIGGLAGYVIGAMTREKHTSAAHFVSHTKRQITPFFDDIKPDVENSGAIASRFDFSLS